MKQYFIKKIKLQGPISISEYMAESNLAPKKGYYDTGTKIGKKGDFITSPEVSQVFGELLGLFMTDYWNLNDRPNKSILVDLGGGNGTMMNDCLRAIDKVNTKYSQSLKPIFIETSNQLAIKQYNLVPNSTIYKDFDKIPNTYMGLIANEFFDALPIKQYIKVNNNWHERLIDIDPKNDQKLRFTYSKNPTKKIGLLKNISSKYKILEFCPSAINIIKEITNKIINYGGIALIIDYAIQKDDYYGSLQAIKNHKYINPLSKPGLIDLSARVDFNMIKKISLYNGATVHGPINQNKFLKNLGIDVRCQQLINANPDKTEQIKLEYQKLMSNEEMGSLFKVIAITNKKSPIPAGF